MEHVVLVNNHAQEIILSPPLKNKQTPMSKSKCIFLLHDLTLQSLLTPLIVLQLLVYPTYNQAHSYVLHLPHSQLPKQSPTYILYLKYSFFPFFSYL